MDLPHLLASMTLLLSLSGGMTTSWRFGRMTTVLKAGTSDLTPMFAVFSKHHAVSVVACRPRFGNRKLRKEWWRKTITPPRSGGGETLPTSSPSGRRSRA